MHENDSVLSTELKWRIWQLRCAYRRLRCRVPLSTQERRLAALRNCHRGRRAFIVGNGPSLRMEDLDRLRENNEITFACNKIYLAFEQTDWRPTYYAAEDSLMFEHHWNEIKAIKGSTKLFPLYATQHVEAVDDAVYFRHLYEAFYPNLPKFSSDARYGIYGGHTVVYILAQFAIYMGIREIYLIGVDFDYQTPEKTVETETIPLCVVENEQNHFHPDYHKPGELMYAPSLHLPQKSFEATRRAFEQHGGVVMNATRGGKLEILPRADFDTLFDHEQSC